MTAGLVAGWEVPVELMGGEEPARIEAHAIMAIDRTRPATPYLMLRAFSDIIGRGCPWTEVNTTVLNVRLRSILGAHRRLTDRLF